MYRVILVTIPLYAWTKLCSVPVQRRVERVNAAWTVSVERMGAVSIVMMKSVNQGLLNMDVKFLVRKGSQVCLKSDYSLLIFCLSPVPIKFYRVF